MEAIQEPDRLSISTILEGTRKAGAAMAWRLHRRSVVGARRANRGYLSGRRGLGAWSVANESQVDVFGKRTVDGHLFVCRTLSSVVRILPASAITRYGVPGYCAGIALESR